MRRKKSNFYWVEEDVQELLKNKEKNSKKIYDLIETLVLAVINKYGLWKFYDDKNELIQIGVSQCYGAMEKYDSSRGSKLYSYLTKTAYLSVLSFTQRNKTKHDSLNIEDFISLEYEEKEVNLEKLYGILSKKISLPILDVFIEYLEENKNRESLEEFIPYAMKKKFTPKQIQTFINEIKEKFFSKEASFEKLLSS